MLTFKQTGNFKKTITFLKKISEQKYLDIFRKYGEEGVKALSNATPVDTGKTASSWFYTITQSNAGITINWNNSNVNNGVPVAIVIQYGHATSSGSYVQGIDYINPALKPVFDKMANNLLREVKNK